jgi:hypothetical protein
MTKCETWSIISSNRAQQMDCIDCGQDRDTGTPWIGGG